ncbi:NAD kinase [Ottowia sp.]|uniref:NAD kinase n=1 Tax=Ottowia sp. TaxID=1898956 RepID=UPI002B5E9030|nr:NAD kinase [Ottowia sp.]HOB67213.1 NAD kinase [Ottowia sp.]HPZ56774.1 NAD kinase [Ottowia sp.]HQD47961.1 NAD kinase [Ottowia sp.]
MSLQFHRVALVGKYHDTATGAVAESTRDLIAEIAAFLTQQGCEVLLAERTAQATGLDGYGVRDVAGIGNDCDLAVVVGGDGTMLGIGRQLARYGTPLIGINQGRLGFITDLPLDQYRQTLPPMLAGAFEEDHRSLMLGKVMREGESVFEAYAMNDVVVNRGAVASMVELRVEVNGHFVANHRADGIIVATPTGSTAYALSAGGPLLHPLVPAWALVPIAPHTLSNRPIVVADPVEIAIEIVSGKDASASFDMQSITSLHHGDRVIVRRSDYRVRFLHPKGWSYFDTLRRKLLWNEGGV